MTRPRPGFLLLAAAASRIHERYVSWRSSMPCNNPAMRRSVLGAICAILLWLALGAAGSAMASPEPARPPVRVGRLVLGNASPVSLNWVSVYWIDERGALPVDEVEARAEQI